MIKNMLFSVKIQTCEPRCGLRVGASLEKPVRACELSGSGQARCHPYNLLKTNFIFIFLLLRMLLPGLPKCS